MMITWVTMAYTNYTIVEYNKAGFPLTLRKSGSITKFTDGGSAHLVRYIHRVKLTGLVPAQRYGRSSFSSLQFSDKGNERMLPDIKAFQRLKSRLRNIKNEWHSGKKALLVSLAIFQPIVLNYS